MRPIPCGDFFQSAVGDADGRRNMRHSLKGGREGGSLSRCCLSCCLSEREKGRESEQRCEERLSNFPLTISSSIKRRRGDDNRDREGWAGGRETEKGIGSAREEPETLG